jgi:hypothetical protein
MANTVKYAQKYRFIQGGVLRTKTKSTEHEYIKFSNRIIRQITKQGDLPSPENIYFHVKSLTPQRGYAWLRKVKASFVYHFEQTGQLHGIELINSIPSDACKRENLSTSGQKKKHITEKQLQSLLDHLQSKHNKMKYAKPIHAFIEATLVTGLRPVEWHTACLYKAKEEIPSAIVEKENYDGGYPALVVKNAKATNGRSYSDWRVIDCSELPERAIIFIKLAINYGTGLGVKNFNWSSFYESLRVSLHEIIKKELPRLKGVSLYTFRHQCIANLKQVYSVVEIALIVGHGNDITATEHYGRRQNGFSTSGMVKPNYGMENRIRKVLGAKQQKHLATRKNSKIELNNQA